MLWRVLVRNGNTNEEKTEMDKNILLFKLPKSNQNI